MDAGNLLKPALARGELHCDRRDDAGRVPQAHREGCGAGAAVPAGVRRRADGGGHDRDPARAEGAYEAHHGVRITDSALVAAATLSHRYITDRFLPDKAIDLIDEAASRLRMENDSMPEELDEIRRRIMQLQIEAEALKKETDLASAGPAGEAGAGASGQEERSAEMTARWKTERRQAEGREPRSRSSWTRCRGELETAKRQGNLQRAGELRYGEIPGLEEASWRRPMKRGGDALVEEEVTPTEIAEVVERWTGIPVDKMLEGEREKLLQHGGAICTAGGRPGRGGRGGVGRRQAGAGGAERSEPADRVVPVPGADGRGQDRAVQGAGGVSVRRRAGDGADRHERVHGAALGGAADRRAAGICRL